MAEFSPDDLKMCEAPAHVRQAVGVIQRLGEAEASNCGLGRYLEAEVE